MFDKPTIFDSLSEEDKQKLLGDTNQTMHSVNSGSNLQDEVNERGLSLRLTSEKSFSRDVYAKPSITTLDGAGRTPFGSRSSGISSVVALHVNARNI